MLWGFKPSAAKRQQWSSRCVPLVCLVCVCSSTAWYWSSVLGCLGDMFRSQKFTLNGDDNHLLNLICCFRCLCFRFWTTGRRNKLNLETSSLCWCLALKEQSFWSQWVDLINKSSCCCWFFFFLTIQSQGCNLVKGFYWSAPIFVLTASDPTSRSSLGGRRGRKNLWPHWILGSFYSLQRLPQPWLFRPVAGTRTCRLNNSQMLWKLIFYCYFMLPLTPDV